jgi:hypothetical protein
MIQMLLPTLLLTKALMRTQTPITVPARIWLIMLTHGTVVLMSMKPAPDSTVDAQRKGMSGRTPITAVTAVVLMRIVMVNCRRATNWATTVEKADATATIAAARPGSLKELAAAVTVTARFMTTITPLVTELDVSPRPSAPKKRTPESFSKAAVPITSP